MSLELLESLVEHPGWKLFQAHIREAWGPTAYAHRLKAAIGTARQLGKDASHALECVDAGNDAIADAMRWPSEEVAKLKRQQQTPELASLSRRGNL